MKKSAIILGLLLVLLLGGLLAAPSLVDWNSQKQRIEAQLAQSLGRDVKIGGDLAVALLPVPSLTAQDVTLANPPGVEPAQMARIQDLRVTLAPLSLLTGRFELRRLELFAPEVHLSVLPNGRGNWLFTPQADVARGEIAAQTEILPKDTAIERILVSDGVLIWHPRKGAPQRLEDFQGDFSLGGAAGLVAGRAEFRYRGAPAQLDLRAGRPGGNYTPVSASLTLPGDSRFAFSGGLTDGADLNGKLDAGTANLRALLVSMGMGQDLPALFASPAEVKGRLRLNGREGAVDDLTFILADSVASGGLSAAFGEMPQVDLALAFTRIDLDRLGDAEADGLAPAAASAEDVADAALHLLPDIAANLTLSSDILVWRGGFIRQPKISASLMGGVLSLNEMSALLPGGSNASLSGILDDRDGQAKLNGQLRMESNNLRAVLDWLGADVADIPADRLRRFLLDARLSGSLREITMRDVDMRVDTTTIGGAATIRLGGRPAFGINAQVDAFDMDAYRRSSIPAASAGTELPPLPLHLLAGFDANMLLKLDRFTANEVSAENVLLDATLVKGGLAIRRASAEGIGGASLQFSGEISGLGLGEPKVSGLGYDIRSEQPERLFRFLGIDTPLREDRIGTLAMTGQADGDFVKLDVTALNEFGGTSLAISGVVSDILTAPRFDLVAEASHADLDRFLALWDFDADLPRNAGGFAASTEISGGPQQISLTDIRLRFGPANIAGDAEIDLEGEKPKLVGSFLAGETDLNFLFPAAQDSRQGALPSETRLASADSALLAQMIGSTWSREDIDLSFLDLIDADIRLAAASLIWRDWRIGNLRLPLRINAGSASFDEISGELLGGELQGNFTAGGGAQPRVEAFFALKQAVIDRQHSERDLGIAQGKLDLAVEAQASGRNLAQMVADLDGDARIELRDGLITGFDLAELSQALAKLRSSGALLPALSASLSGGRTEISALTASFSADNGIIRSSDVALNAAGGHAAGMAVIDLPSYAIDARALFRLDVAPDAPPIGLRLIGPMENPRRIIEANEFQAWMSGRNLTSAPKKQPQDKPSFEALMQDLLKELQPPAAP